MYFLRRLRSFNICSKLLRIFYQSVVASVLFYTVVCWGGSISKKDTSRLDKLIRRAGSVVGMKLDSLVTVAELGTLDKLLDIMDNVSHPLHTVISNQRSLFSERLLLPKCRGGSSLSRDAQTSLTPDTSSSSSGGSEAFPGQPRDVVSPACPGSSPKASWDMPGTPASLGRHPRGISKQMPKPPQLTPLNAKRAAALLRAPPK
ncbi:hypothetical protein L3Q82_017146 [Scortum barcoo]|uniref:Uncharacterized protein n=1 Tax=Scortum barcoo TaxID=214431 RepID=A0ACB8XA22_9TELE|nr:hypothetical protein L3Q82_017146 [Scortum barcoo]